MHVRAHLYLWPCGQTLMLLGEKWASDCHTHTFEKRKRAQTFNGFKPASCRVKMVNFPHRFTFTSVHRTMFLCSVYSRRFSRFKFRFGNCEHLIISFSTAMRWCIFSFSSCKSKINMDTCYVTCGNDWHCQGIQYLYYLIWPVWFGRKRKDGEEKNKLDDNIIFGYIIYLRCNGKGSQSTPICDDVLNLICCS